VKLVAAGAQKISDPYIPCGCIHAGYLDLARVTIKVLKVRERSHKRPWWAREKQRERTDLCSG
jgi:hypothetical protein